MELISFIIPVFNTEKYVERCINSILNQTYTNIEVIVIDDGSTDKSGLICDDIGKRDHRVKVIHQNNGGVSVARNTGLDTVTGDWIVFVDSDDFIAKDFTEYMLGLCTRYKVDIAECKCIKGKENQFPEYAGETIIEKKWNFRDLYVSAGRKFRGVVWGKIYKTELLADYRYPVGMTSEDEDAAFKLMYKAKKVVISNKRLYYYYESINSYMRAEKRHANFDFMKVYEDRLRFLKERNEMDLVEITKKEFAIRLMMHYISGVSNHIDSRELIPLKKGFYLQYKSIKNKKNLHFLERTALFLFYLSPDLFAFLENRFSFIKRAKIRRNK